MNIHYLGVICLKLNAQFHERERESTRASANREFHLLTFNVKSAKEHSDVLSVIYTLTDKTIKMYL